jgi:3'(2'), 5'-bisphosphate nucleotidase
MGWRSPIAVAFQGFHDARCCSMSDELEVAKELALGAGDILLKHFAQKTSVRWKGPDNPVTDADQEASRFIVDALRQRFPLDGILSEEERDAPDRLGKSRVWIIDPMDGTSEFVAGRTEFAVMIGLAVEGKPVMGVVYLPAGKKLYFAELDRGAFLETGSSKQQLHVFPESNPGRAILAASRSHDSVISQRIRAALGVAGVVHAGGVGLKVAMICDGRAHLYIHAGSGTNQWDTCAPEIILHEAMGTMTDVESRPLRYNTANPQNLRGVIASNGLLHVTAVAAAAKVLVQPSG